MKPASGLLTAAGQAMQISSRTHTVYGLTPLGSVPPEKTSKSDAPMKRSRASAIWLRAELPVQMNRTRIGSDISRPRLAGRDESGREVVGRSGDARHQLPGELPQPPQRLGPDRIVDPGSPPLTLNPTGLAQHLEVVRDRGLAHPAAVCEVAGADRALDAQLAKDCQPGRIGDGLEQEDVGICGPCHARMISNTFDIDNHRYRG